MFSKLLKITPAVLAASLLVANSSLAQTPSSDRDLLEQLNRYNGEMDQVNSVRELRDVAPGHWAYEALRNLIERYRCIRGYEDGTYRGTNGVNRYEFAVTLNKCLQSIERLIVAWESERSGSSPVSSGDLRRIQRLTSEFEAELAILSARVDDLEGKVDFLEDHQFSTTTKLKGEVIFTLASAFGEDRAARINPTPGTVGQIDDNITLSDRVRLNFDTSFTGKDRLRTRLQAGNFVNLRDATNTDSARLGHDAEGGNNIELNELVYHFPVGDKTRIYVGANDFSINDVFPVLNPYLASSGSGALARFGRRNSLVHRAPAGAGAAIQHKFNKQFKVSALYLTTSNDAANPASGEGLFNGTYSAGVQLDIAPTENWDLSLTYLRSFQTGNDVNLSGSTGSRNARRPFGENDTEVNHFGINTNYKVSDRFNVGGWFGLVDAQEVEANNSATIINWSVNLAFPDLGKDGNVGGIIFGQPATVTSANGAAQADPDTAFHIEALYKYKVSKNISVTPGVYVILNPESNSNNDTIVVGAVRTTFKF